MHLRILFLFVAITALTTVNVSGYGYGSGNGRQPSTTPASRPTTEGGEWGGYGSGEDRYSSGDQTDRRPQDERYPPSNAQPQYGNQYSNLQSNFSKNRNYVERYGYPEACVQSPNFRTACNYYVEISKHEGQKYDDALLFELGVHVGPNSQGYVAVGLSKDKNMGEDHIIECVKAKGNNLLMSHSWSEGRSRPIRLEDDIRVFKIEDHYPIYDQSETLICKFWRNYVTNIFIENSGPKSFDLLKDKYYILLAEGPLQSRENTESIGYHGDRPLTSGRAYVSPNYLGYSTKFVGGKDPATGKSPNGPKKFNGSGNSGDLTKPMGLIILFCSMLAYY